MNTEKLKKIEDIYHSALELSPDELESLLAKRCGEDKDLRREVVSLLAFRNTSDNLLDTPPESLAAEMFSEKDKPTDIVGKKISHYKIIKLIGRGGMGEVYLAEDENLNRNVALKFLPVELTGDNDRLKRFEREAHMASGLNHPNILTIHQFGTENDSRFIVTEFIKGITLSEKMASGRLSISETLDIATQVTAALAGAHKARIIHRDIKPDNIMIRADGLVKVLDFGLAKLVEKRHGDAGTRRTGVEDKTLIAEAPNLPVSLSSVLTNPGVVMGTADYMSPEQARGKAVDARTDIFSVGVVLYEMLTEQKPFTGETVNHTIVNILEKQMPSVFDIVKDCPAELEKIINKTLAKETNERFQTAKDLLSNLKKLHKRLEFEAELIREGKKGGKAETEKDTVLLNVSASQMPPNNLTENSFPIIGRQKEIAELNDLLKQENTRLLTMTGIGGTGKTRLAQTVARQMLEEFADGVFFVTLASITDHKLVVSTIAKTLGVKESGGEPILEVLKNYLRDKQILLVIDNFEQVLDSGNDIAELLDAGDKLKILITSREHLHLSTEHEYAVSPLTIPSDETKIPLDELSKNEAVRFFVERAKFAQTGFASTEENVTSIVGICRRLDGLPLAIELAAVRVKLFSPSAILTRLSDSLKLLTGGAKDLPERQQTMRGAIAWSYDLLDVDEKKMLKRLAVFAGGFTIDGAEAVAFDAMPPKAGTNTDSGIDIYDGISSLLDKSLIIRSDQADDEPRFRMLVVVQEFALEKLEESGEAEEIKRRHTDFYTDFSEKAGPELYGAKAAVWGEKFEQEHDNIRTVLRRILENEPQMALQITSAAYGFWFRQGYLAEGCGWMTEALEKSDDAAEPKLTVEIQYKVSDLFMRRGDYKTAVAIGEEGLRLSRRIEDKKLISRSIGALCRMKVAIGDYKSARKLAEESLELAREINDQRQIGYMLNSLGESARCEKDYPAARKYYEEALENSTPELNDSPDIYIGNLACVTYTLGDYQASRSYSLEVLKLNEEFGDKMGISQAIGVLAALALKDGKLEKAARLSGAEVAIYESIGHKPDKVDQNFIDIYTGEIRAAIGDEAFNTAFAEGHKLSLKKAIALARKVESDFTATHTTDGANSENILTNDALEPQTAIFAPSAPTNPEISRPHHSLLNIQRKQIFVMSLIILLLATIGFFGYRYFITDQQIKSIAILPFVNETGDANNEYLSDGMTENLISSLSNIPNLSVKARSTVFTYKGMETLPKNIGKELNVDAVLFGRLVQRKDSLKLNLELVNTVSQNILWSQSYELRMKDLVSLQGEIARNVSEHLNLPLTTAEQKQVTQKYTENSEAQQMYLRGRFHWNKRSVKDFEKAIGYFKQAIEKDPNYALAYAGLADTYALMPLYGNFRPKEYMPKAKQSVRKAIELDENLAEAHASFGRILNSYDFDWKGAEREYRRAIELNPNYATTHQWYAEHLALKGMQDEALKEISKALELDPFSVASNRMKGIILTFAKRYDEAIAHLRKTEELYPENVLVKFNIGDAYAAKGLTSEAVEQYLLALKLDGQNPEEVQKFTDAYKNIGWKGFWLTYLESLLERRKTLLEKDENAYINNESIAYAYAATGNKAATLEYLNKAYKERDPDLVTIKMSQAYDFLADDPQFKVLIKNIGLPR